MPKRQRVTLRSNTAQASGSASDVSGLNESGSSVSGSNVSRVPFCAESLTVPVSGTEQLHLARYYVDKNHLRAPVLMVHSIARDGSSFTASRNGGLAAYLAREGYDVYVIDLRGHGKSWPKVSSNSSFGVHQLITEDIPAAIKTIVKKRGDVPQLWVGHGWGGVLLCSYLARYGDSLCPLAAMVQLGSRRRSVNNSFLKAFVIDFIWARLCKPVVWLTGYLPAGKLALGDANETANSYRDYLHWSRSEQWLDPKDGFDYGHALKRQVLPSTLYLSSGGDSAYGHPDDVRRYALELGRHDGRLLRIDRERGGLRNYNHDELIGHADAEQELFPLMVSWFEERLTAADIRESQSL